MKKILFAVPILAGIVLAVALQAHADPVPNDVIRSTPTISIFTCDFAVATPIITNSPAMVQRNTFAIQNISAFNMWIGFDATVNINHGWRLAPYQSISIPVAYYSAFLKTAITPYCLSEGAPGNIAVLEGY